MDPPVHPVTDVLRNLDGLNLLSVAVHMTAQVSLSADGAERMASFNISKPLYVPIGSNLTEPGESSYHNSQTPQRMTEPGGFLQVSI